jgi:hypothetical protein
MTPVFHRKRGKFKPALALLRLHPAQKDQKRASPVATSPSSHNFWLGPVSSDQTELFARLSYPPSDSTPSVREFHRA